MPGAVYKHIESFAYCTNCNKIYNCFEINKRCSSYNDLLCTKCLLIKIVQPSLNNQLGPDKGSRVTVNIFK